MSEINFPQEAQGENSSLDKENENTSGSKIDGPKTFHLDEKTKGVIFKEAEGLEDKQDTISLLAKILLSKNTEISGSVIDSIKKTCEIKKIDLNIDKALEVYDLLKDKFYGFSEENLLEINKVFISVAAQEHIEPLILNAAFARIEFNGSKETSDKIAKIENNNLIIFSSMFKNSNSGKASIPLRQKESILLHELGHVVDFSGVLNEEAASNLDEEGNEYDSMDNDFNDVIKKIPLELNDKYTIEINNTNPENTLCELKATLFAIWARNKNNPNGFVMDRLNQMNASMIQKIFKGNPTEIKERICLAKSENNPNILKENVAPGLEETFDSFIDNSLEIHTFISERWDKASKDPEFLEQLSNIGNLDFNEYADYDEPTIEKANNTGVGENHGTSEGLGETSLNEKTVGVAAPNTQNVDKTTSLGEVFAESANLISAIGKEMDFITPN